MTTSPQSVNRCRLLRAGFVALALASGVVAQFAGATEQLTNRSFDTPGGAGWSVNPLGIWAPFLSEGEVDLHRSYQGFPVTILWQDLDINNAGGVTGTASMQLKWNLNPPPAGISTMVYLDYLDGASDPQRLLLLNPQNSSVGAAPDGTLFSTTFTLPADAQKITGFSVDRTSSGFLYALEFSLDLVPVVVNLASPTAGATYAGGATIPLVAAVQPNGESLSGVEFYDGATLIGAGQSGLTGQWSFPNGSSLFVMPNGGLDYSPATGGMYVMGGVFSTPQSFSGQFTTWPGGATVTGNVSIGFSFAANNTLHAAIFGDSPLGTVILDGGINNAMVRDFSLSWPNATPGTHVLTARAYYASGQSVTSAPVSITVGAATVIPTLAIRRVSTTRVELSWADVGGTWQLEQQAGLAPGAWTVLTGTPVLADGRYSLTVTMAGPTRFYRLRNQ